MLNTYRHRKLFHLQYTYITYTFPIDIFVYTENSNFTENYIL